MLEVNVHSSSKPAVTTVSQSQDNNPSSVETVSGPGSKEQPSYQSDVEAVGKDAGVQSGPQVTYADTVSDEDAAKDIEPFEDIVDGAIVGSNLLRILEESNYSVDAVKEYVSGFKKELNENK